MVSLRGRPGEGPLARQRRTPPDRGLDPYVPGEDAIDRKLRVNEQIRISPVRVINAEGDMLGVMPTGKAMEAARERVSTW